MKQTEIKNCAACNRGVCHDNHIAFFRVSVEHLCVDPLAIQRQAGLEMMLGNAALAFHMGPQEDIAKVVSNSSGLVCQECWLEKSAGQIWEALGEQSESREHNGD